MKYSVHESFYTFQGEGVHSGQPAFFVRLHGCPLKCHFCDSAGTWHPEYVPENIQRLDEKEIVSLIPYTAPMVILTGGEPAMWDLNPLTQEIMKSNRRVHLETSGAFPLRGAFHWVTVSPKRSQGPLRETLSWANELKLIIEKPDDIEEFTDMCHGAPSSCPIYLHPEWSKREDPKVLAAITLAVKNRNRQYRAGWQIHKLYRADDQDPNSRRAVPLGGDPSKGY